MLLETLPALTSEQQTIFDNIVEEVKNPDPDQPYTTLGGFAGTGKTVLLAHLLDHFKNKEDLRVRVGAYTGKAVDVLRKKGISEAQTLHRILYRFEYYGGRFHATPETDIRCDLLLVDESSMVSPEIHEQIMLHHKPVIYIGDHGQLPPVNAADFNLMGDPKYKLEHIHRQAEESKIIVLSEMVRKKYLPSTGVSVEGVKVCSYGQFWDKIQDPTFDQIIVGYNRTRVKVNREVREALRYDADQPVPDDKIICLRNNHQEGLYNGMGFKVLAVEEDSRDDCLKLDIADDLGNEYLGVRAFRNQFNQEKTERLEMYQIRAGINLFDFGYAVTAHKSQGSEYDSVLALEELHPDSFEDHHRWRYTVVSRAKKNLVYCR